MWKPLLIASLFAGSAPAVAESARSTQAGETGTTYISIDADAVPEVFALASSDQTSLGMLRVDHGIAVFAVDARELPALSEQMHADHHRCGGFIVHASLDEALAATRMAPTEPIDYTIDHGDAVRAVQSQIDDREILSTIRSLSSRKNRYYRSESGADVSRWLRDRWRGFTSRSDVTVELFDQGYPQQSVIMTIPGTTHPDEIVVIGGHIDSIALGGNSANAPGADDDASGIATLDQIARVLLAADFRPARTVQFMAYAAEEVGLRGSQAIVRDYQRRGVHVVGALQLDMTNYRGSDRDIWLIDDYTSPAQNRFVAQLIEHYTTATWGVDRCGYACSDHASWQRVGVPASFPHETRSVDRNKNIHTARDTLEISHNNAAHAAKFAQLGVAYAIEMGKGTLGPASETAVASVAPSSTSGGESCTLVGSLLALAGLLGLGVIARRAGAI